MTKRLVDFAASLMGLILLSPIFAIVLLCVWLQDFQNPLFVSDRAGKNGEPFRMVKIRSMIVNARNGIESTSADDKRITPVGHFVRRWKLDELSQLWNVLRGDMSLVGPRPNTLREVADYTLAERKLLSATPGITDISSIVFSDEGEILQHHADPEKAYKELIRPWKSRLGLFYVEHRGLVLDFRLIWLTMIAIVSKPRALASVSNILKSLGADTSLVTVAKRTSGLLPTPLP